MSVPPSEASPPVHSVSAPQGASSDPANPVAPAPDRSVPFKKVEKRELSLHVFEPSSAFPAPRPGIVFFHGGGWTHGRIAQFFPHAKHLASRGMVAICAEYRIASVDGTTPAECVKDAKSAIRWIRAHAGNLGIDPGKLAAGGGSAGGHIAAASAVLDGFNEEGDDPVCCVPDALVLFNPVIDNGPGGFGHDRVAAYWQKFSPLHNLREGTPPTIFFLGSEDALIPVATAERYRDRMQQLGARCDLHVYEGMRHGFFNLQRERFPETLLATDRFLTSLGYLPTADLNSSNFPHVQS